LAEGETINVIPVGGFKEFVHKVLHGISDADFKIPQLRSLAVHGLVKL
jgi:hypothetical protein